MDPALTKIPEVKVDLAVARAILARLERPLVPVAIERIASAGASGAIYRIDTAADPALILKVYPHEPHWRMEKEAFVGRLLEPIPEILSPHYLLADDSQSLLPYNFAVMTLLQGEPLARCEDRMTETELHNIWAEVGAQLRHIHRGADAGFRLRHGR